VETADRQGPVIEEPTQDGKLDQHGFHVSQRELGRALAEDTIVQDYPLISENEVGAPAVELRDKSP
jgi:hypothetical protein